jgi:hypothetical protein
VDLDGLRWLRPGLRSSLRLAAGRRLDSCASVRRCLARRRRRRSAPSEVVAAKSLTWVRHRACPLLAYSLRKDARPMLRALRLWDGGSGLR